MKSAIPRRDAAREWPVRMCPASSLPVGVSRIQANSGQRLQRALVQRAENSRNIRYSLSAHEGVTGAVLSIENNELV